LEERQQYEEERRLVRAEGRKLHHKTVQHDEDNIDIKALTELMRENEKLYDKVKEPEEAVTDAKIIRNISRLILRHTTKMSANAMQFRYTEYAAKLARKMKADSADGTIKLNPAKFIILGREAMSLFNRSPTLSLMKGSFKYTPPPEKKRKQREVKQARKATKISDLVSTQAETVQNTENTGVQTQQMVVHVLTCLITKYKENGKKPLNYFRFMLHPTSFGESVENLFHISFLIKEGKAKIFLVDEVPHIKPVKPKKNAGSSNLDEEVKNQTVINFSMYQWRRIVNFLEIKEPMIWRVGS